MEDSRVSADTPSGARHRGSGRFSFGRGWAWVSRHAGRVAVGATASAFVLATGLSVVSGSDLKFFDEQSYLDIADNLAYDGIYSYDGTRPTADRPPAYPFFLAAFRVLGVGVIGLRIVNAILFALAVYGIYLIGRRILSPAAGALAAAITAFYPPLVYTVAQLYPQALSLALIVGVILAAFAALDTRGRRRVGYAAAGGLAWGALALTAPAYGMVGVLVVGWLVLFRRKAGGVVVAAALVGMFALLPAAWTVRNLVVMDAFVVASTNDGFNLLLGNNPNATPTTGVRADISAYDLPPGSPPETEVEQSERYRRAAIDWIKENPADALWLYIGKVANHFTYSNEYATEGVGNRFARDALTAVVYLPMLGLFIVRLAAAARRRVPLRSGEGLLATVVLAVPFPMAIYTTRIRYRLPLDCIMFLVALGIAHKKSAASRSAAEGAESAEAPKVAGVGAGTGAGGERGRGTGQA